MDDAGLADRTLAGDRDAFAELVQRHQRWVTVVALRATGNLADADDVAQDVFLRAYRGLGGWRREASFRTWLAHILRNRVRDRGRSLPPEAVSLEESPDPAREPDQERRMLDAEMLQALERAYAAIPAGRQREVLRLRFVDGLRLEQIAATLGLRVGTVKAHLFRAVHRLERALAPVEEGRR